MRAIKLFAIKVSVKGQDHPVRITFGKIAVIEKYKQLHSIVIFEAQAIITVGKSEIPREVNIIP